MSVKSGCSVKLLLNNKTSTIILISWSPSTDCNSPLDHNEKAVSNAVSIDIDDGPGGIK